MPGLGKSGASRISFLRSSIRSDPDCHTQASGTSTQAHSADSERANGQGFGCVMPSRSAIDLWHPSSRPNVKNFHLPLPEQTYSRLRAEAERTQVPATALAREAID